MHKGKVTQVVPGTGEMNIIHRAIPFAGKIRIDGSEDEDYKTEKHISGILSLCYGR